jgi:hypothetical protein
MFSEHPGWVTVFIGASTRPQTFTRHGRTPEHSTALHIHCYELCETIQGGEKAC